MLQGNFYHIEAIEITGSEVKATLSINAAHIIFKGHFPSQPIVPGVCMVQMIKELLEMAVDHPTNLIQSAEIKFLAIIDPEKNNVVSAALQYSMAEDAALHVSAKIFNAELIHFKCKAIFKLV